MNQSQDQNLVVQDLINESIGSHQELADRLVFKLRNNLASVGKFGKGGRRLLHLLNRHHTFILQGVRDLQAELDERGIGYVCHVERPGHRGPHLRTLARQAALMVTEDMPVQPTWGWLHRLIETTECPVWCVDTACVVPMRLVGKAHDRAFRFRQATAKLYRERLTRAWEDLPSTQCGYEPEQLPFPPIDVRSIDLPDLIGQCEIDHKVGSVPHTAGGSVAGYLRWERFRRAGLSSYARRRNDPLVAGVSGMSAHLHYGRVSPLRIAREAAEQNADKFLVELLIWRELAHNLCFHRHDHERLSVLPGRARDTLLASATDDRPAALSWERLARGRTDDALGDPAQISLLIHGELHNNVRMTWGKALPQWTADAETALAAMTDLNHRYALEGRGPCPYGGILWCLGLFDRPFPPPRPIFGTIRERPTAQHVGRLDTAAYRRHSSRPLCEPILSVAVIGACGDWCSGPRVEGAFLSGAAMAGRVLGLQTEPPKPRANAGWMVQLNLP